MRSPSNLALTVLVLSAAPVFAAAATESSDIGNIGYVRDSSQEIVRSSAGNCWHTGSWTPALATVIGCDGVLAKAVPVPVPAPAPPTPPAEPAPPPPAAAPPLVVPPPAPVTEKVTFETDAFFDFDKAILKPEGKNKLTELAMRLSGTVIEVMVVTGHTDSVGKTSYNEKLSLRRAEAVKIFLQTQGLPEERISIIGKGEAQPIVSNKSKEGRAKNRRVEVEVVSTRKRQNP